MRTLYLCRFTTNKSIYESTLIRLSVEQSHRLIGEHNVHSIVASSMRTATLISFYTHTTMI